MDAPPATVAPAEPTTDVPVVDPEASAPAAPPRPLQELLDEGTKHLATRKYPEAIESFSLALEQL